MTETTIAKAGQPVPWRLRLAVWCQRWLWPLSLPHELIHVVAAIAVGSRWQLGRGYVRQLGRPTYFQRLIVLLAPAAVYLSVGPALIVWGLVSRQDWMIITGVFVSIGIQGCAYDLIIAGLMLKRPDLAESELQEGDDEPGDEAPGRFLAEATENSLLNDPIFRLINGAELLDSQRKEVEHGHAGRGEQ